MSSRWKIFSDNIKRLYEIIFEDRDIEIIRSDYFSKRWISKQEMHRLIEHEETEFVKVYNELQTRYDDMMKFFNMNSYSSYAALEQQKQGKLKK